MKTTISISELFQIINGEHGDPHQVLGMHELTEDKKEMLVVRVYIPGAKEITILDVNNKKKQYKMTCIHEDGFFECRITDCNKWFLYQLHITDHTGHSWINYDPYAFPPTVTDYDRYLFGAGNHYQIYEKLGAHACSTLDVPGVRFAVWAPNAVTVSLMGNFNNWDPRRNPMRMLEKSGIWEIFMPGVVSFDQYKFHIKTKDGYTMDKADPFAFYAQLRPNTASVVYDSSDYLWQDGEYIKKRNEADCFQKPMNIYEVHLGSWMRVPEEGNRPLTYMEAAEKLVAYVLDMGFSHIELMPIEEHPFDGSWGYQVTGYYAPTSRYGTPHECKAFIDLCHKNGIGVILDWVPAHFPKDIFALARFDGSALFEHQDPKQGEHPDWGTYIFNFGRNEVRNFLIANALYWIEEFHFDGLRVDAVASLLYLDYGKSEGQWVPNNRGGRENLEAEEFLKHLNSVVGGKYPGVMMIAEESTSWAGVTRKTEEGGLGFSLKWNMGWMNDYLMYLKKDPIYRRYHHGNLTFSMVYAYTENFILVLSHDEVVHGKGSMAEKMPGDMWQKFANLRLAYGFMYGHPGKKLLFMGNEFGQFSEWSEARSLDWHLLEYPSHQTLHSFMKDLNHLYQKEPAFYQLDFDPKGFEWISCDDREKSVVSFIRRGEDPKRELIFVCNFTPNTYFDYRMGVPLSGTYQEILNSDEEKYGGSGVINRSPITSDRIHWDGRQNSITIKVPPLGMAIFVRSKEQEGY